MIQYKLAGNEQFDDLLGIIYHVDDPTLRPVLDLTQLTWDQFGGFLRTTGRVYRILWDGCLVGLCWVEICGPLLRLHGLAVRDSFQGRGIGTHTLYWLEETFRDRVDEIELQVHASNPRAHALYTRCGYEPAASSPSGFYTLRKKILRKVDLIHSHPLR